MGIIDAIKQYISRKIAHCLTEIVPRKFSIDAGKCGPSHTVNNTRGKNTAVNKPRDSLNRYSNIPMATASPRYNIEDADTAGPNAVSCMTALNVWAVISVNAMMTYNKESR